MKKQNLFLILVAFICLLPTSSCKKSGIHENTPKEKTEALSSKSGGGAGAEEGEFDVATYGNNLMADAGFVTFVKETAINTYYLRQAVEVSEENPDEFIFLDEREAETRRDNIINSFAVYSSTNTDFIMLSNDQQTQVMNYITESWQSAEFREANPDVVAPLLTAGAEIIESIPEIASSPTARITTAGVVGCAIGVLSSALSSYGDAIDDIRYLVTQGFSGGALISAATSIIRHASPWWKVFSIAIGFVGCIVGIS